MLTQTLLSKLLQVGNLAGNLLCLAYLLLLVSSIGCHLSREVLVLLHGKVLVKGVRLHF